MSLATREKPDKMRSQAKIHVKGVHKVLLRKSQKNAKPTIPESFSATKPATRRTQVAFVQVSLHPKVPWLLLANFLAHLFWNRKTTASGYHRMSVGASRFATSIHPTPFALRFALRLNEFRCRIAVCLHVRPTNRGSRSLLTPCGRFGTNFH